MAGRRNEVRCYEENKDIEKAVEHFEYIRKQKHQEEQVGETSYLMNELVRLKGMYDIVNAIYEMNDFKASSISYRYVMPRINALLQFLVYKVRYRIILRDDGSEKYEIIGKVGNNTQEMKAIEQFCHMQSLKSIVKQRDGSEKQIEYLEYIYVNIRRRMMAIAGRYYITYNIEYLEQMKYATERSYPSRRRILEGAVWWFNNMLLRLLNLKMPDNKYYCEIQPKTIIFSTFPSSGKSFLCNTMNEMFSELAMIIQNKGGVLRVGNQDTNIQAQSMQTKNLIHNELILDIYPENIEYIDKNGKYNPFGQSATENWGLAGAIATPNTSIFKTRDSAINSIRCQLGIFDDPSRGQQENNNTEIHKRICNLYNGDFQDRFESRDKKAIILCGTMYNPYDVFSTEMAKALESGYTQDKRFRNVYISEDKETVVIINDCENEDGSSAYPEFISDKELKNIRESLPAYDYHCTWRQKPIPSEGLVFSKELLQFYDELPPIEELTDYAYAAIDPTRRKPSDFFSMPIFKYHAKSDTYYLVDIIFERKSVLLLYDSIIKKIFTNNIIKIAYEENTDTSLGMALREKLKKSDEPQKATTLQLIPITSTQNKMKRISDMEHIIKRYIRFPSEKKANSKTQMGLAVHMLTEFNGDGKSHDDFPDSLAMFADKIIISPTKRNTIKTHKNLPF